MKRLPHRYTYNTTVPDLRVLKVEDRHQYYLDLFTQIYEDGYEQAQQDIRDALGIKESESHD